MRTATAGTALGLATLAALGMAPAAHANTHPHLSTAQRRHIEHVVHHLPYCSTLPVDEQDAAQNCRNRLGHHRSNASFRSGARTIYVELHHGRAVHVEVYR